MSLCCDVLKALQGKTLVTAESLTGGGIGAALTQVSGSSEVYKGGVICYTNWVKENILGVPGEILAHGRASGFRCPGAAESRRGRGGHGPGRPRRRRIRTQRGNGFHRLSGRGAFRREGISLLRRPGSGAESDHRSRTETCSGTPKVKKPSVLVGGRKTDSGAYRYRYAPFLVPKLGRLSHRERQERCDAKIKIMPAALKAAGICCAQVGS